MNASLEVIIGMARQTDREPACEATMQQIAATVLQQAMSGRYTVVTHCGVPKIVILSNGTRIAVAR